MASMISVVGSNKYPNTINKDFIGSLKVAALEKTISPILGAIS